MGLMFNANEITERNVGLTYDDVLLMPRHCEITSRTIPNLETRLTKSKKILLPFIASNMDTVTETLMASKMAELGGHGILHRFMDTPAQVEMVKELHKLKSFLYNLCRYTNRYRIWRDIFCYNGASANNGSFAYCDTV